MQTSDISLGAALYRCWNYFLSSAYRPIDLLLLAKACNGDTTKVIGVRFRVQFVHFRESMWYDMICSSNNYQSNAFVWRAKYGDGKQKFFMLIFFKNSWWRHLNLISSHYYIILPRCPCVCPLFKILIFLDVQGGHYYYSSVIWYEGGRSGGSFGMRVDVQGAEGPTNGPKGGHLGCPWTNRGLSGLSRGRGQRPNQWMARYF